MPAGEHARGGDTQKQNELGFRCRIDFREGVSRALKYFERNIQ
jgi:hypothetical protein